MPARILNSTGSTIHPNHYNDVIMGAIASQITSLMIVYSTVYSDADQRKHQSSASLAFVWGIHRGLVKSPRKWPVTRKMFPFDDVIMIYLRCPWDNGANQENFVFPLVIYNSKLFYFCRSQDVTNKVSMKANVMSWKQMSWNQRYSWIKSYLFKVAVLYM